MDLQKLRSGFGPACFKLMCALLNRRFKHQKRVMDMDPKVRAVKIIPYSDLYYFQSFLPNMKRALVMKNYEPECTPSFENPIVGAFQEHAKELFNFNGVGWQTINEDNCDDINFPHVNVNLNQASQFDELTDNDVYWASIGPYEIKTAAAYLNTTTYEHQYFEAQLLEKESDLYRKLSEKYFLNMPLNVLRLRIPSSHKKSGFNQKGYKVYLFYQTVVNFSDGEPDLFELDNFLIDDQDQLKYEPNYYFKYGFPFSFCTCKSGMRTVGVCAHRMAAIMFFGHSGVDFSRKIYRALDSLNYNPLN